MDKEDLYQGVVKAGDNWTALEQVVLRWRKEHPTPHFEALMESYWRYVAYRDKNRFVLLDT